MKLSVFRDHYEIETVAELRAHLSFRHDAIMLRFGLLAIPTLLLHLAFSSTAIVRLPFTIANLATPDTTPMAFAPGLKHSIS